MYQFTTTHLSCKLLETHFGVVGCGRLSYRAYHQVGIAVEVLIQFKIIVVYLCFSVGVYDVCLLSIACRNRLELEKESAWMLRTFISFIFYLVAHEKIAVVLKMSRITIVP